MATLRQKRAFKEITERNRAASVAMREVGYAPSSTTKPSQLTRSKGFLELCEKIGLTDEMLGKALVEDILGKPKRRSRELELGFKVVGRLNPKGDESIESPSTNNFIQIVIHAPDTTPNA